MAYPWTYWKRTLQLISCQWSYSWDGLQVWAFHGDTSYAWCTPRKFSLGTARRCRCVLNREILGGDGKVLCLGSLQNLFPAIGKCLSFLFSPAVVFPLSFLRPTSQCSQALFLGYGLGRGKSNFSFLLQLSCKSLDFHIYFLGSLCAIILIRSLLPLLCYSREHIHIP